MGQITIKGKIVPIKDQQERAISPKAILVDEKAVVEMVINDTRFQINIWEEDGQECIIMVKETGGIPEPITIDFNKVGLIHIN